jgi:C-terminal processing protease CtpA/Prc
MVRVVVASAKSGGKAVKRPWLGARLQNVTPEIAETLGLKTPSGALVVNVTPKSPADKAGLKVSDLVTAIDGQPIDIDRHFGAGDAASIVLEDEHGVRHTKVVKGVELPKDVQDQARYLPGNILLLSLDEFDKGDDKKVAAALRRAGRPAGVILDLRENGGGDSAVLDRIAGQFVQEDQVIVRLTGKRLIEERTRGAGRASYDGPLAVLVGPRTASAAEILAAFIEDSGRGFAIGQRTAGAATGGVDYKLPDGGELSVAEYDLRTASGKRLEGHGFTPLYPVKATLAELRAGKDPVLQKALALLARSDRRAVR